MELSHRVSLVLKSWLKLPSTVCLSYCVSSSVSWESSGQGIKEGAFSKCSQIILMSQCSLVPLRATPTLLLLNCPSLKSLKYFHFLSSLLLCYPGSFLSQVLWPHDLVLSGDPMTSSWTVFKEHCKYLETHYPNISFYKCLLIFILTFKFIFNVKLYFIFKILHAYWFIVFKIYHP